MNDNIDDERPKLQVVNFNLPRFPIYGPRMVTMSKTLEIAFVATTSNNRIRQVFNESLNQSMTILPVLSEEQLWFDCADSLMDACKMILEFVEMIPGFTELSNFDQVELATKGAFQLSVIRMSRYINPTTNCLVFNKSTTLPKKAFYTTDVDQMDLVSSIFKVAKDIADLKLTVAGLGMYSAIVLLNDELPELIDRNEVRRLKEEVLRSFKTELDDSDIPLDNGVTLYDVLIAKIPELRVISLMYVNAAANFNRLHPDFRWPELHEVFFGDMALRANSA